MAELPKVNPEGLAKTYSGFGIPLILPAWIIIGFFLVIPVAMMLVYSFLTKEFRGGVIWEFSISAYDQFFLYRGLFGEQNNLAFLNYNSLLGELINTYNFNEVSYSG